MKPADSIEILLLENRPELALQLKAQLENISDGLVRVTHVTTPEDALRIIREGRVRLGVFSLSDQILEQREILEAFSGKIPSLPSAILVDPGQSSSVRELIGEGSHLRVLERVDGIGPLHDTIRALYASEETLWETPLRYLLAQELVQDLNDVVYLCDLFGVIRYISPNAEKTVGYTAAEIMGRRYLEFVHPQDAKPVAAAFVQGLEGGSTPVVFRVPAKNGEIRWVRSSGSALAADGRIIGVRGLMTDITAEKERETQLEKQQSFFRNILDSVPDMITVMDETGTILFVNRPWREVQHAAEVPPCLDGHPGERYAAKVAAGLDAGNETLRPLHEGIDAVLVKREARWECEIASRTAAGMQWYLATLSRLLDGSGNIVVSLKNISERKLMEESLAQLSTAVKQSPAAIVITDLAGNIEYVNPGFERLTGYALAEVAGKNPRVLQSGKTPPETYAELWATLLAGSEWRGEFSNKKKNGEIYWETAVISPIRNPEGEVTHYVAIKENITRQKEMQEELIAEKLRAEHASRIKEIFIANMSHEIRTPLTAIIGYAELMQMDREGMVNSEGKEHLAYLKESSNRLLKTIENILHYSAIEAGTLPLTPSTINLTRELAYLVATQKELAAVKGISLSFENLVGEAFIRADERTVSDAFQNLLDNALKFTERGKVEVCIRREKTEVIVSVQDTGVGIAPEYQSRMFELFTQEEPGYAKKTQGLGLGLALARRYIESNGGTIAILSRKHVGTTAYVRFPEARYTPGDGTPQTEDYNGR